MQMIVKNNKRNEEKNMIKRKSGITLIALVITIIVLLILAGVSIAMLTGDNGILTQAKLAKENTALAKDDEETKLVQNSKYINEQIGKAVPGKIVTKTEKDNYSDGINTATVPQGFTVSGKDDEQTISKGLVIYDIPEDEISSVDWNTAATKYNQFVWIPVASEEAYQRELSYPCFYDEDLDATPANSTTTDTGYLPADIQPEIDEAENNETAERTAVLRYNGFYIARYEAGNENSNVVSKQDAAVYTDKSQTDFKTIGKTMYGDSSNYVKSAMCSGIQWDMVMKFVDGKLDASNNENNIFDVRTANSTRHTESKAKSGKNLADKVQNIYDLEGNRWEYVAEKSNKNSRNPIVHRGGYCYYNISYHASTRGSNPGTAGSYITFRPVLYIK